MRRVVISAATIALLTAAAYAGPAGAADTLTIVSFGGAYSKSQIEAYHKPYTAKTGIRINSEDYNGGLAQVRAQVEAGNVIWNLVDVQLSDAIRGCDEGVLESIDPAILPAAPDGTPAIKDFIESTLTECAVGTIVWSTVFAFDASKYADAKPTRLADFFDTEKFPGKRGLRKVPSVNLDWALMADGVPLDQVYDVLSTPEGVDRAFAKLDTIKDDVIWWEAGAQPPQMLADGEVSITSAYNGRLFNAVFNEKKPFEIIWDGQVWDMDLWAIPKGAKNMESTLDFVKFSTDTQRLADQSKWIPYGPARKSSFPLIAADIRLHMPTAPDNFKTALQNDYEFWADHTDELNERFAAWLAK
ncbi:ABC transporter substrate-binding protein [Pelagibius sp. Alg239-R121]|uniref:ABC transporter substrate-binding protein n=1 Tax=Pelagibius sp. Alg239-R121 TaxID=2993448 RepID=UPI0024A73C7C|nr:ABC transporter substrate-binding protein [Pelagibius sp. Alg239-R121]